MFEKGEEGGAMSEFRNVDETKHGNMITKLKDCSLRYLVSEYNKRESMSSRMKGISHSAQLIVLSSLLCKDSQTTYAPSKISAVCLLPFPEANSIHDGPW